VYNVAPVSSVLEFASVLWYLRANNYSYYLAELVQHKFIFFAGEIVKKIDPPDLIMLPLFLSLTLSSLADKRFQANLCFLSKL